MRSPRRATGRPGPVLIDIPVTAALAEFAYEKATTLELPGYKPTMRGHTKQLRAAAKASAWSISARPATGISGFGLGSNLYRPGLSAAEVGRRAKEFVAAFDAAS